MALAFYFSPTAVMTPQVYDECLKRLKKAGAQHPAGRVYHACFAASGGVNVFDVWTSQAAFDKFGQTLMPILQQLGVDPGQPRVMEIHNVVIPPKPAARSAAGKRSATRRAASKKRGAGGRAARKR